MTDPAITGEFTGELGGELLSFETQPITLLDPKTGRAVRVLCWTLTVLLWGGLVLGIVALVAVAAEFT